MQQRIKGLEKTLAQVLRNQTAGPANHMVNLQSLMSSSPKEQQLLESLKTPLNNSQAAQGGSMVVDQNPGASSKVANDHKPSLAKLMESSDDDRPLADMPLSSLSSLSDRSETRKKRARMSSPPPVPPSVQVAATKRRTKNAPTTKRGTRTAAGSTTDRKVRASISRLFLMVLTTTPQVSEDVGRRTLKRK
jgi:hypothetical protein